MDLKEKRTRVATLAAQAKALYSDLAAKGDSVTQEDRDKLDAMLVEGQKLRKEIQDAEDVEDLHKFATQPASDLRGTERHALAPARKSWGQIVVESKELKNHGEKTMDRVEVKALYEGTDATGDALIVPDRQAEVIDIARQRVRRILPLVNHSRTMVDVVQYILLASRTNNAAPVAEYASGNFGLKPESDMTFDLKEANVKTIATWIPASKQILDDAPRLRAMVDNELTYMLEIVLDSEILAGDGSGQHFTGINNWSGIQTRVHRSSGRNFDAQDTLADTIRKSLTDITLEFYEADAILLNPTESEKLELLKDDNNNYLHVYDPVQQRVWRVPVVDTPAQTAGTGTVGNFRLGATIWDRMMTQILVGQPNDYFLRNAVAVLAELRAAFAVTRPLAFEKITGL